MAQCGLADSAPVTGIAGRILEAWKTGQSALLRDEIRHAVNGEWESRGLNPAEMEKMEVLESAAGVLLAEASLSTPGQAVSRPEVRAALRLLEHLAGGSPVHAR